MKKLVVVLLSVLLACCVCAVNAEDKDVLTYAELDNFMEGLIAEARDAGEVTLTKTESGMIVADTARGLMEITDEEWSETTGVVSVLLGEEIPDMRGLLPGVSLEDVLRAYPNDNAILSGTYYDAVLYAADVDKDFCCGYVVRDGQEVINVCYDVYHTLAEETVRCGVRYAFDGGYLTDVYVSLDMGHMTDAERADARQGIIDSQEMNEYFAYMTSEDGTGLTEFGREDVLLYNGIDLVDMNPAEMVELFGNPDVDEWIPDTNGNNIRVMEWEEYKAVFLYDSAKKYLKLSSMSVIAPDFEGPRGAKIGEWMDQVMNRFYRESVLNTTGDNLILYGDGVNTPYGQIVYNAENTVLYYAFTEGEDTLAWMMTFVGGTMINMMFSIY